MFGTAFKYEFLRTVRSKSTIFWLVAFPIILGCFFKAAFSGVYEQNTLFKAIPVAVVNIESESIFEQTLKTVSSGDDKLLEVQYVSESEAKELLKNKKITGIINAEDLSLSFISTGVKETIVKSFIQQYKTQEGIIKKIAAESPEKLTTAISALATHTDINKNIPLGGNTDNMTQYFYNLLAMTALFGSLLGLNAATDNQANLSAIGARKNCTPINKITSITASLCAYYAVQTACMLIAVSFLNFVLRVDFGGKLGMVYLSAIIGGIMGISMGFFIGSIGKCKFEVKVSIAMATTMISCFLSGLMVGQMKALIAERVPFFNEINPAAVISDAFYCLNIYSDYRRFTVKIVTMLIMAAAFTLGGYVFTRRRKYASL